MVKRKRGVRDSEGKLGGGSETKKRSKTDYDGENQVLHYTKSGQLDMRFKSSKEFVARQRLSLNNTVAAVPLSSMSVNAVSRGHSLPNVRITTLSPEKIMAPQLGAVTDSSSVGVDSGIELTTDPTDEDLRYAASATFCNATSKGVRAETPTEASTFTEPVPVEIPRDIPLTKSKLPDLRTKKACNWVKNQAKEHPAAIERWLPRLKDGSLDTTKAVTQYFLNYKTKEDSEIQVYNSHRRLAYYHRKLADKDSGFDRLVQQAKLENVSIPPFILLHNSEILHSYSGELRSFSSIPSTHHHGGDSFVSAGGGSSSSDSDGFADVHQYKMPTYIPHLDYKTLEEAIVDKSKNKIGNGAFGLVYKTTWNGKEVALKKLHLNPLTRDDRNCFMMELKILASFGDHPNLVKLYGFTTEPASFVMEYIRLGSLSHLLYHCQDTHVEARLCDGRIKKRIAAGIVNGMRQLHAVGIIHGDIKPCNVLITDEYTAKITDFGLSKLRGKTSSLIASRVLQDAGDNVIGGTAAYLAPELLQSDTQQDFSSDVYSFGILLNELIHEEEPYCDMYHKIRLMGPFGAAQLAKQGVRPRMNITILSPGIQNLIKRCWSRMAWYRQTFNELVSEFSNENLVFPSLI